MGLERRRNGLYYYSKKRVGNKVVSVYEGGGDLGALKSLWDEESRQADKAEKEAKREAFENEKAILSKVDEQINAFSRETKAIEEAFLLINGYHEHSRAWRQIRDDCKKQKVRNDERTDKADGQGEP